MNRLILGTAGHIDHGKTTLVHALTGVDTDRLPEEKQRGITIDLGFAQLQLGDTHFGIVDVPGHEGFIRNMLAGATGMDAVLLVVAADEGVMPQTREHLAILDLLGVSAGVVAVTKSDLVDADWAQLVVQDIQDTLRATSLAAAPVVAVSARTGSGLDELRTAIRDQASRSRARASDDVFRMPIDRVFTVRGTGTVVTGTVWSGMLRAGQHVHVGPAGIEARVRGLEVHGTEVSATRAGERTAIALSGVEKSALARGDTVTSEAWPLARMLTIKLRMISDTDWTLKSRQRVHVHLGTRDVLARVMLLDAIELRAGETGWVQLRLEAPLIARAGDRVVLRSYSPVTTIAGGVVAEIAERKRSRLPAEDAANMQRILDGDSVDAVAAFLSQRAHHGASLAELALHTPHSRSVVEATIASTPVERVGTRYFTRESVAAALERLTSTVARLHQASPLKPWLERAEVRGALPGLDGELLELVFDRALAEGRLVSAGRGIKLAGFEPTLSPRQLELKASLVATLSAAGLAPPSVAELGAPDTIRPLLRLLEIEGQVRALGTELFVDARALAEAEQRTRVELAGREALAASDFRSTLPVTRKHLIPLLEYFDRAGITVREGELRRVADPSQGK